MNKKRIVVMLFAILVGAAVAAIINRQQVVKADRRQLRPGIDIPIVEAGCIGDDRKKCFTEEVNGRKRTYYGTWQERTIY